MSESLKNKAIKGAGWSFADSFLSQGVSFLVSLVLARLLLPEDYGLLTYLTILISISNSIVDSGFSNALIRKVDASDVDYNTTFFTNLTVSCFLVLCLYFAAPSISIFCERPELISLIRMMSCIVVINAFSLIQKTKLTKQLDFKTQTKASFFSSIISGFIGIAFAIAGFGVWSLVGQQISRQLLYTVCLWFGTKWIPRLRFSIDSFKELFGFGWKLLVSGLLMTIWNEIYQIVIGKCYSPAILGHYTRAHQFGSIFSTNITSIVQRVSYPILSEIQCDRIRLKFAYERVIRVTMLITFILMMGLASIAKPLVLCLIGENWLQCVPFLQIICFSMMLNPLHSLNLNMLQVLGRSDLILKLEIIKKFFKLVPILLGVFVDIYYMLVGSIVTSIISFYLNAYYSGPFLNYSIKEQVKDILPSFGVAVAMAIPVYAMNFITMNLFFLLPLQILVGAVVTIAICEATKLTEYLEIKGIVMPIIKRLLKISK